jgi:hypothetical protein
MRTLMRADDTLRRTGRQRAPRQETTLAMTHAGRDSIEHFVRGTLGCGCPDEVFRDVVIDRLPAVADRPAMVQLLVGSRLLIHVVAPPDGAVINGWIEQLVSSGRAVRDCHGYNRFRLVIASQVLPAAAQEIQDRFARASVGDGKAHLHFVGIDQLPADLEWPAQADSEPPLSPRTVAK